MAVTFELFKGRTGDDDNRDLFYKVKGTSSDLTARTEVEAAAPSTYDGLARDKVVLVKPFPPTGWLFRVHYVRPGSQRPETNDSKFRFSTTGGSQHITQSIATSQQRAVAGVTAPNFGGAIGVTKDSVEGVDIGQGVYEWSETHYIPDSQIDDTYKEWLRHLTWRTNDDFFRGFEAGEVLFMGCEGGPREDEVDWEIEFHFAASENLVNQTVGQITGINKKGHEYLWCSYEDSDDEDQLVKQPIVANVEQVYYEGDFDHLNID